MRRAPVVDRALSLMKSPQNYRGIPRFLSRRFNLRAEVAEAARWRNLNSRFMLSGDERDRTANLLVANQALSQLSYVPSRIVEPRRRLEASRAGAGIPPGTCTMIASSGATFLARPCGPAGIEAEPGSIERRSRLPCYTLASPRPTSRPKLGSQIARRHAGPAAERGPRPAQGRGHGHPG